MKDVLKDRVLLQQVLTATTDAVMVIDRTWVTIYMNEPALAITRPLGYSPVGREFWSCFPEAVYPGSPYVETYYRAMDQGIPGEIEAYYPAPLDLWFHVQVRPTDIGIILFTRNITLQKRMTASLVNNERLASLGRLSAVIAHEINNPLDAAQNALHLAQDNHDFEQANYYIKAAKGELERINAITRQTLRVNKASLKPTLVNSNDMLKGLVLIFEGKAKRHAVALEIDLSHSIEFTCFEGEIRQVLSNLVGNAIDAMTGPGRIVIRIRLTKLWKSNQPAIRITVADSGCGMSLETRKRLFDPFFTTKGMEGTGLGLWISQQIIRRHSGQLLLRSSENGTRRGTTFCLVLPVNPQIVMI